MLGPLYDKPNDEDIFKSKEARLAHFQVYGMAAGCSFVATRIRKNPDGSANNHSFNCIFHGQRS